MNWLDAMRGALEALRANPTRSLLTTLGIIIGVAAVIVVVAVGSGARSLVVDRIKSLGSKSPGHRAGRGHGERVHLSAAGVHLTSDDMDAIAREVAESGWPCRSSTAGSRWSMRATIGRP